MASVTADKLKTLQSNVKSTYEYFKPNYDRFNEFRKFVFDTALTADDTALLNTLGKPDIESNILEAFVSRLRGEFSKQEPSISVRAEDGAQINPKAIDIVEGHMRHILFDANNNSFEYDTYTDLLSGGFSVMKVWTEFAHEMSFDQVIKLGRVYDPTLCGFDPVARYSHKGDGAFCFEIYPKTIDELNEMDLGIDISKLSFSRDLQGFNWSYRSGKDDIALICDYYEKKKKRTRIVQLVNGQVMTDKKYQEAVANHQAAGKIEQPPAVMGKSRMTDIQTICRYRFVENQIIEYVETDYRYLPLIFADGNSVLIKNNSNSAIQQMTRPYVYHARGAQKLKNFAVQSLANEIENMVMHKWKVAKEGIPPEYTDAYTDNQTPRVIIYNAFKDNDPQVPLPPPMEVARVPIPPEIANTISLTDQMTQTILGAYDASLGINDNQLSGVAIVEGATQSNSAAMPYVVGFLQALNQSAQIIVDLIPKYNPQQKPRSIPIVGKDGKRDYQKINQPGGVSLDYGANTLAVRVEAGVNFSIQKTRALNQIVAMMKASPLFAQFMNVEGLPILLDNLEIRGVDQLKILAEGFVKQMKEQQAKTANQPNPLQMKAQTDQQKIQLEMQKLQQASQHYQQDSQLHAADIANDAQSNQNDHLKIMLDAQQSHNENIVQAAKAKSETFSKAVELALATADQGHQHSKDKAELAHKILSSAQQPESAPNV
jgi:hypothetical protein